MIGLFSNNIRIVSVDEVDYTKGTATTTWEDVTGESGPEIKIPHPYVGVNGEGIFVGLQKGSLVAVGMLSHERPIALGTISLYNNIANLAAQKEASYDFSGSPGISSGDIIIQGLNGSKLKFDGIGSIILENKHHEGTNLYSGDGNRFSIKTSSPVEYIVSQSGIKVRGNVRRDIWIGKDVEHYGLTETSAEFDLEEVGWDPSKSVTLVARNKNYRNPVLVEDREIIYEYGRDFYIGTLNDELKLITSPSYIVPREEDRRERRNNVLSLSLTYPNELIEKFYGTVVDFFGNILDINKNRLPHPFGNSEKEFLNNVYENMRHSVAYHMAMNARKGWAYRYGIDGIQKDEDMSFSINLLPSSIPEVNDFSNNAKDRSKWEVNVDKEGLTVINIPATSETGTIPRLVRYETSSVLSVDKEGNLDGSARTEEDAKKLFRNAKNQDIFVEQIGPGGIDVVGEQIVNRAKNASTSWVEDESKAKLSPEFIQAGTAFHDIRKTAKLVLEKDINKKAVGMRTLSPEMAAKLHKSDPDIFPSDPLTAVYPEDPESVSSEINASVPDFNNPSLLQKIYVEDEEYLVDLVSSIVRVKNKGIVKVSEVSLIRTDLITKEEKKYYYDIPKQTYYIKDIINSYDPYAVARNDLSDSQIQLNLNPIDFPWFPMPMSGDKILVSYYYKGKLPNAGGRSVVLNLDGSLETSIGANTIDRVSWTLDTAGALIARLGRDRQGRSAIIQADGYVAVEIGGWDFIGEDGTDSVDTRFVGQGISRSKGLKKDPFRFKGGKLTIRIRRTDSNNRSKPDPSGNDHLIIIDDTGITIQSAGSLNLISKQTMTLQSDANICFNAPNIVAFENSTIPWHMRRSPRGAR